MANIITDGTPVTPPAVIASNARLTYYDLISAAGDFLGLGTSPTGDDLTIVRTAVARGYRRFLNPPILKSLGDRYPHTWSWLAPAATLTLAVGDWTYTLPADFAQILNDFVYPAGANTTARIKQVDPAMILKYRQGTNLSGDPRAYAIRPLSYASNTGQLYQVIFWPTPSTIRTLTYRYAAEQDSLGTAKVSGSDGTVGNGVSGNPDTLTTAAGDFSTVAAGDVLIVTSASGPTVGIYTIASVTDRTNLVVVGDMVAAGVCSWEILPGTIYPLGAVEASEALLACCLWAAEMSQEDRNPGESVNYGPMMEELEAAIQRDRMRGPRYLGVNRDGSDLADVEAWPIDVTYLYNGVAV